MRVDVCIKHHYTGVQLPPSPHQKAPKGVFCRGDGESQLLGFRGEVNDGVIFF